MPPILISVASAVLVADQFTKWLIRIEFLLGETRPVIGDVFHLTYYQNSGMAFGFLQGFSGVIAAFSIAAIGFLIYLGRQWRRAGIASTSILFSLGLVIGGAAGNLVDRFAHSGVIDFLDFGFGSYRWPAFNIADVCISVGVGLLVLFSARREHIPAP